MQGSAPASPKPLAAARPTRHGHPVRTPVGRVESARRRFRGREDSHLPHDGRGVVVVAVDGDLPAGVDVDDADAAYLERLAGLEDPDVRSGEDPLDAGVPPLKGGAAQLE